MSRYCLDSNFFITAHRYTYPFDVIPSFWGKIGELANGGQIFSIDKVKNEIFHRDDELKQWCEMNLPDGFFKETNTVLSHYAAVANWAAAMANHFLPRALTEFLHADEADAWLVSYAMSDRANITLVTHELSDPLCKRKVKIPDCCIPHGVSYCDTMSMLRNLGARI